jgi:hypothetical protein
MSLYDDDWGEPVAAPRRISLPEQEQPGLVPRTSRNTFVAPGPAPVRAYPIQPPANDAFGALVAGLMAEARTVHHADPVSRGLALLLKATAVSFFLGALTLAALAMLDSLEFFLWLFLASAEWVLCFLYLAYNDWREHPSAIRWQWTQSLLGMMEREHEARLKAQYGEGWDR